MAGVTLPRGARIELTMIMCGKLAKMIVLFIGKDGEPSMSSGKPCIGGMRITVQDVLEPLPSGMSEEEILSEFPYLVANDIRACLAFAADRERRLAAPLE